jgi:hypothetical protein
VWFALAHKNNSAHRQAAVVDTTARIGGAGHRGRRSRGRTRDISAFAKRTLPNGTELNIPANGIESQLIGFIEDRIVPPTPRPGSNSIV